MPLKDTLLRASDANLYQIRFSQEILDGATRNLIQNKKMTSEKAERFQRIILNSFPDALVQVDDNVVAAMTNHPNDRHQVLLLLLHEQKLS